MIGPIDGMIEGQRQMEYCRDWGKESGERVTEVNFGLLDKVSAQCMNSSRERLASWAP